MKAAASATSTDVGGGAINEKARLNAIHKDQKSLKDSSNSGDDSETFSSVGTNYAPSKIRSHLWHALEGLDRYPNYLSRWNSNEDDIDKLEQALQEQLDKVRQQRARMKKKRDDVRGFVQQFVLNSTNNDDRDLLRLFQPPTEWDQLISPDDGEFYNMLDSDLLHAITKSRRMRKLAARPSLEDILSGRESIDLEAYLLEDIMEQESFDVFSLPILTHEFCDRIVAFCNRLSSLANSTDPTIRENYLHVFGTGGASRDLDLLGLGWINNIIFHLVVRPISRHLFLESEQIQTDLDWRQGYIAGYSAQPTVDRPRQSLVTHTDDSEVTCNLCLIDETSFDGGQVAFHGLRNQHDGRRNREPAVYEHIKGRAILHSGRNFHQVLPVTRGDRFVYILWARSWSGHRRDHCPCCWLNRRMNNQERTDSCICGPRWN